VTLGTGLGFGNDVTVFGGDATVFGGDATVFGGDATVFGGDVAIFGFTEGAFAAGSGGDSGLVGGGDSGTTEAVASLMSATRFVGAGSGSLTRLTSCDPELRWLPNRSSSSSSGSLNEPSESLTNSTFFRTGDFVPGILRIVLRTGISTVTVSRTRKDGSGMVVEVETVSVGGKRGGEGGGGERVGSSVMGGSGS